VDNFISKLRNKSTKLNGSEVRRSLPSPNQEQTGNQETVNAPKSSSAPTQKPGSRFVRGLGKGGRLIWGSVRQAGSLANQYRRQPWYIHTLVASGVIATTTVIALVHVYWTIERGLPSVGDISKFVRDGTLTIKAADGGVLQQLGPATRDKLTLKQMPDRVVKAFLAAEDRRFYQHNGVDYQSVVRAMTANVAAREFVEGASTITQQLARTVYLNQERSVWRKLQEAFMAQKLERELNKQQILERYLNLVYLGSSAYGVGDAAWVYFSKAVDQLTLGEVATIAGLPPAPSDYSPLVNLKVAQERRNIVLERMQEAEFITAQEAATARSQPLKLKPSTPKKLYSDTPYFTSYIRQELPKYVSKEQLELGGLTVETTLNPRWQKTAENVVKDFVINVGPNEGFEQGALVAIDPKTGEIRAMVGGTNFTESQFNRATQAQRQPGSTFKTLLYTTAIATGMSPNDGYMDAPYMVDGYQPQNYGRKHNGWMTLKDALTNSVNVISVKLIIDVGFDPVLRMARDMGIQSKLLPTYSLALGASEVNLLELTSAHGTLAARGEYAEAHGIRRIFSRKGELLYSADPKQKQVVDELTVAIVTWMMQNVVNSGTGRSAQLDRPVAGKTGTSEEARDLWFIGFTPQLVTGVWLGNDDSAPTGSASTTAASMWRDFMAIAMRGMPVENFPELPDLLGRQGSIKAQPFAPGKVSAGEAPKSDSQSGSQSGGRQYDAPPSRAEEPYYEPAPPRREAAPAATEPVPTAAPPALAPAADPVPVAPVEPQNSPAPEPALPPPVAEPPAPVPATPPKN
jgi:penicillin-binding protein 1A